MNKDELLRELAQAAGIELGYWDLTGRRHEAPIGTLQAIVAALGFDVSDAAACQQSSHDLRRTEWESWVARSVIARQRGDGPLDVRLRMPAATSHCRCSWAIEMESGQQVAGEFVLEHLDLEWAQDLDGQRYEVRRLRVPMPPVGYHQLTIAGPSEHQVAALIIVPERCYLPERLGEGSRLWGVASHVYALRSTRNWGIGDFGDLEQLMSLSGAVGAAAVAINPCHALAPRDPERASPYAPSSRLFLNPLLLDVERMSGPPAALSLAHKAEIANLRQSLLVDYSGVARLKWAALQEVYADFLTSTRDHEEFERFKEVSGAALHRFATFQALDQAFANTPSAGPSWQQWPVNYRQANSAEVLEFAEANRRLVDFHKFLQWQADRQLAAVAKTAAGEAMPVGLGRDISVGVDPAGADVWAEPQQFLGGLRVGAPPDAFSPDGQEWGVAPPHPLAWRRADFQQFVGLLRANMKHAGLLRIDHVMGFERLFCIPAGGRPGDGTYLRFPREDLFALLALESHRNRCMVVGEDLGTVPEGFRERMAEASVFGCRVLYFEQDQGEFRPPSAYPAASTVMAATHDLPTLAGYWQGRDLKARHPDPAALDRAVQSRKVERAALLRAVVAAGFFHDQAGGSVPEAMTAELAEAIHRYLAATPAQLLMVQLDDVLGEIDQLNLPGTTTEHPNWRRKLSLDLETIRCDRRLRSLADQLRKMNRGV